MYVSLELKKRKKKTPSVCEQIVLLSGPLARKFIVLILPKKKKKTPKLAFSRK